MPDILRFEQWSVLVPKEYEGTFTCPGNRFMMLLWLRGVSTLGDNLCDSLRSLPSGLSEDPVSLTAGALPLAPAGLFCRQPNRSEYSDPNWYYSD